MTSAPKNGRRLLAVVAGTAAVALALVGCAGAGSGTAVAKSLIVGTTDVVTFLDPAGSYDNGSLAVQTQVFPYLFDSPVGSSTPTPDIAASGSFTSPTQFTVKLKKGLKFANGHDLTSSDVKFSFDRQTKIADPNGPSYLLANIATTAAPDPLTVVFTLKAPNDQTFVGVLSSPAGPIVDEQVFSPDKVTSDADIVKGKAFAGQYSISSYKFNNLVRFTAFAGYKGNKGVAKTQNVDLKYYTSASNLKLDVQQGNIDVAYRSLSATDVASLKGDKNVKVHLGPGGEIRYIVFDFDTQPFGTKTANADPAKALAVRQAAADLIDRDAIATQVYKGTYTPLYSYVPQGVDGATTVLKDLYGTNGKPDAAKAKAALDAAGVATPVKLSLQYVQDGHYGPSSAEEYALVKSQLEATGLFAVDLKATEYVTYNKDRVKDVYPAYQLGWFPDYADADNYLSPFFSKSNFLVNHYDNAEVQAAITKEATETDPAARKAEIQDVQAKVAADLSTLPLLQGSQVAVAGSKVQGVTLDGSFKFRFGGLYKSK
ncbi:MAG: peptide transporter substrate-binding protein [Glaciihabitans sp.]|nr:peptide transporter substrate-binding protein [Glaciihabitans sp.]MCU1534950.1 peptide transporter substrate-binding protein [Glaciihabitans sp.]MDQ1555798.1 peptide/nickel transport system substrate-binding protein [Actinomycetota bacterium]